MKTKVLKSSELEEAAHIVSEGGLVAIKTDTVYGLAVSSDKDENYARLVQAKERPETKPFPLMVSSLDDIERLCDVTPLQRHLMHAFMPGAVTFIFNRKETSFSFLNDQKTLGIRMADDPWVWEFINKIGNPIWLPSANRSGLPTATSSSMVLDQLSGRINGVIEGEILGGKSSSVFDLSGEEIVCLREGIVSMDAILKEVATWNAL